MLLNYAQKVLSNYSMVDKCLLPEFVNLIAYRQALFDCHPKTENLICPATKPPQMFDESKDEELILNLVLPFIRKKLTVNMIMTNHVGQEIKYYFKVGLEEELNIGEGGFKALDELLNNNGFRLAGVQTPLMIAPREGIKGIMKNISLEQALDFGKRYYSKLKNIAIGLPNIVEKYINL